MQPQSAKPKKEGKILPYEVMDIATPDTTSKKISKTDSADAQCFLQIEETVKFADRAVAHLSQNEYEPKLLGEDVHSKHIWVECYSVADIEFQEYCQLHSSKFAEWHAQWRLLDQQEGEACAHPGWIASWLRTFQHTLSPNFRLAIIREGKRLMAVVPVVFQPCFAGSWNECLLKIQDVHPLEGASLAVQEDDFSKVVDALLKTRFNMRKPIGLVIDKIGEQHFALDDQFKIDDRVHFKEEVGSRAVLDLSHGYDAYLESLGKKQRASLRRTAKQLEQLEQAEVEVYDQPETITQAFASYCQVESQSWKAEGKTDLSHDYELAAFYRSWIREMAWHGEAVIALFRVEGQVVGGFVGILLDRTLHIQKISYNHKFAKLAPGCTMLEWAARKYCTDHDLDSINLVTNQNWHRRWNPVIQKTYRLTLLAKGVSGLRASLRTFPLKCKWKKKSTETGMMARVCRGLLTVSKWFSFK